MLLGAIIAVGAYTAWHVTSGNRIEIARVAPVPERLEQLLDIRRDVDLRAESSRVTSGGVDLP